MLPASTLDPQQTTESSEQDPTSTSGIRALGLTSEATQGSELPAPRPHLRAIVVTPERAPALGGAPTGAPANASERFQVEFAHDTQFFAGLSHDLSDFGIMIDTYRNLPLGTTVHLAFELPNGFPIEARGTVRSIREESPAARRGLAIAFTDISESSKAAISEFCRSNSPLFLDLDV